jgi:predicted permease
MLRRLANLWRLLAHRDAFESEMTEEMRFHLESRAAELVRRGMPADAARRQARLEFGNPTAYHDRCRDARRLHLVDDFLADLRFTFRGFRKHKLLTAIVVVTLTFGIGISCGVFTLFSGIALQPPVQADRDSFFKIYTSSTTDRSRPRPFAAASVEEYLAFRDGLRTVKTLAAYGGFRARLGADAPESTHFYLVTCNFFDVYGPERPHLGRLLQPADCDAAAPVMVLSHTAWLSRFDGDPSVIGRLVSVAGVPFTIVGVAPRTDASLGLGGAWLPYTLRARLRLGPDPRQMAGGHHGHERFLIIAGRLAPGATRSQLAAEVAVLSARYDTAHPGQVSATAVTNGATVNEPNSRTEVLAVVALIMGALSCLVLVACANVATLLLSRADARQQEIALRMSLGAGRGRVLRMLLTETLTLAACAGAASLYVAYQVPAIMAAWIIGTAPEIALTPDWRVFAYLAATVLLAGVTAGMAPALESMRVDVLDSIKGRRSTFGALKGSRFRAVLVATQVALGFVLLVASSLFLATHLRMVNRQVGFETEQVLMPRVNYRRADATPRPSPAVLAETLNRVPGTRAIAFAQTAPVFGATRIELADADATLPAVSANEVSPGFFAALDLPIVRGRPLDDGDAPCADSPCHVVVSQSFARQILKVEDPIGRIVHTKAGGTLEIVGVSRDTAVNDGNQPDAPLIYLPWTPDGRHYQPLVRFAGGADTYAPAVNAALRERFPGALVDVHTLRWPIEQWGEELARVEALVVALGGAAAVLAAIGVFGVVSFAVARRGHELGVRVALGAGRRDIYATVLAVALKPVTVGLVLGLALGVPAALLFARVLIDLGLGASARNPLIYVAAGATLVTIMLAALVAPARRAASIDPLAALRTE